MVWSAETPDGSSIIVVGIENKMELKTFGPPDDQYDEFRVVPGTTFGKVWKINSADGAIVWEMNYDLPTKCVDFGEVCTGLEEFETV